MSMLGLKSLPQNHWLHGAYRVAGGIVGVFLVVLGVLGLVMSGDRVLGVSASTPFSAGVVVVGVLLVVFAVLGGNVAAEGNALLGALLMVVGLLSMLVLRNDDWNVLDATMTDVIVLFVVGMALLTFGVYGRVGDGHGH